MKTLFCAPALAVLIALASGGDAAHAGAACAAPTTPLSSAVKGAHTKASSFAPHGHPGSKVYGQPIQAPILHPHRPKKPHPVP